MNLIFDGVALEYNSGRFGFIISEYSFGAFNILKKSKSRKYIIKTDILDEVVERLKIKESERTIIREFLLYEGLMYSIKDVLYGSDIDDICLKHRVKKSDLVKIDDKSYFVKSEGYKVFDNCDEFVKFIHEREVE